MMQDASIGVTDDVLTHISDSLNSLKDGQFKEKFSDEDKKWLDLIHPERNPTIDLACMGLQAMLKKKGMRVFSQVASYAELG